MDPLLEKNLITTKEASEISGYAPDYLSRLARDGKISARRIGRSWLIDSASLEAFVRGQDDRNTVRARALARAREEQYLAHRTLSSRAKRALATSVPTPVRSLQKALFRPQAFALLVALAVVGAGAAAAQADAIPMAFNRAVAVADEAANGFHEAFGDIPAGIAARISDAMLSMRARNERVAERFERTTDFLAQNSLPFPTQATLRMRIEPDAKPEATPAPRQFAPAPVRKLTLADLHAAFETARSFVTSPEHVGEMLAGAYESLGVASYRAEQAAFGAYLALV
ncbi:MAG TPA: helix-turn-helix domain-containing protein, partial [Candidatus Paceibacterota bacterium]|nr:helix-turn-helix domain-containing protein [Candidatus Paceibacterota bacterium]